MAELARGEEAVPKTASRGPSQRENLVRSGLRGREGDAPGRPTGERAMMVRSAMW